MNEYYAVPRLGTTNKEGTYLEHTVYPSSLFTHLLDEKDLIRKTPLVLPSLSERTEEIIIKLSQGLQFDPEPVKFQNEYVDYTEQIFEEDFNTYRFRFSLKWLKEYVPVDDLSKIQPFVSYSKYLLSLLKLLCLLSLRQKQKIHIRACTSAY